MDELVEFDKFLRQEFSKEEIEETIRKLASTIKGKGDKTEPSNMVGFADQILWPEFKAIKNKHGLYGFINGESCAACTEYLKALRNIGSLKNKMVLVLLMKEHQEELLKADGVTVPLTRIYSGGLEPIWEKEGVLYSTQIESLYKAYRTLGTGKSFHTMDEFDVFKAVAKPSEVQAFVAKDYISLELLGKQVIARPNQVVVLHSSTGAIEVLDQTEFDSRYSRL